ncbi:DUF1376 domain-containing protein [Roseomonas chloroacetimidivorans]|uniref:DUF1376 domain-containing protein n=1 Tax=Roseomonas chloroacetimidivorans TaxID=1766656 RepID=UPI003C794A79
MSGAPEPLTPPECDLRDYPWMPLDAARLLDSSLFARSTGDEFKAAVALWCKAWGQLPAGSLPDDDRDLAHLSGAGSRWSKVKEMALHGWRLCSDGRLYHPVVAEKANEAWERKLAQRARTEAARAAKAAKKGASVAPPASAPSSPVTASVTETVTTRVADSVTEVATGSTRPDQTRPISSSLRSEGARPATEPAEERRARGCQIPEGWRPGPEGEAYCRGKGLHLRDTFEAFRDHHRAKGTVLRDWDAGWRTWCQREVKFSAARTSASRRKTPSELIAELDARSAPPGFDFDGDHPEPRFVPATMIPGRPH